MGGTCPTSLCLTLHHYAEVLANTASRGPLSDMHQLIKHAWGGGEGAALCQPHDGSALQEQPRLLLYTQPGSRPIYQHCQKWTTRIAAACRWCFWYGQLPAPAVSRHLCLWCRNSQAFCCIRSLAADLSTRIANIRTPELPILERQDCQNWNTRIANACRSCLWGGHCRQAQQS